MKKDLAAAYAAKRKRKTDLDLEPRESKANLFSNEEMSEPVFLEPMSDDEELTEAGKSVPSVGDNTSGNALLDSVMKRIRSKRMGG